MADLSNNEKKVLLHLVANARVTDSEISKNTGLTVSSVSRIRERLNKKNIIQGYMTVVDPKNIGINCFVMVFLEVTSRWWKEIDDDAVKKLMASLPQVVAAIRTTHKNYSYIIIYGFPDNNVANDYFANLQRDFNDYLLVSDIIFLSTESFLKNDPRGLLSIAFSGDKKIRPNKKLFESLKKSK